MVFAEFEAVCVSFDGSLDAFFIVGFQDVVEGFEIEGLDGELAVACGEDDFDGIVSSLDFLGAFEAVHEGHFDVKEEDVYVRVDVQEVEDFFSVLAFSDDLDAGNGREFVFQFSSGRDFVIGYQDAYVLHGSKAPFLFQTVGFGERFMAAFSSASACSAAFSSSAVTFGMFVKTRVPLPLRLMMWRPLRSPKREMRRWWTLMSPMWSRRL